jgi:hypothetical protein
MNPAAFFFVLILRATSASHSEAAAHLRFDGESLNFYSSWLSI